MKELPFPIAAEEKPFDVVGLGENSIDHLCVVPEFPVSGGKTRIATYELQGGGQIATAMVACQRLGLKTKYLGKVGDDLLGALSLEALRREGVDVEHLARVRGAKTGFAFILIDGGTG